MIAYTSGELKHRSFPDTYVKLDHLEDYCGADIICSPLSLPCKTELMLAKHIRDGALLVQIKDGSDLPASFTDGRMFNFIERSAEFCRKHDVKLRAYQRIVLPLGVYVGNGDDELRINNRSAYVGYKQFLGALARVGHHGAFVLPYVNHSHLYWCLEMLERHSMELKDNPVQEFVQMSPEMYEASNSPLQELVKVKDGRRLLRALGLSETDANAIWSYCEKNTAKALRLITDERFAKSKDNTTRIKLGKIKTYRERLGLSEGELL